MDKKNKNVVLYFDVQNISRSELLDSIKNYCVDLAGGRKFLEKKYIDKIRLEYQLIEDEVNELIQYLMKKNILIIEVIELNQGNSVNFFEVKDILSKLVEELVNKKESSLEDICGQKLNKENLECALELLPELEKKVLCLRYALEGGIPKTIGEVSEELGLTREKVRLIETRAIRKLRMYNPIESKYTA